MPIKSLSTKQPIRAKKVRQVVTCKPSATVLNILYQIEKEQIRQALDK